MNLSNDEMIDVLELMAKASAEIIMPLFSDPNLEVDSKQDDSPVTIADKEAEKKLREIIEAKFPSHGIIGEEFPNVREDAEYVWILDPIDGTKSFISGSPLFGTLVCLSRNSVPVWGMINIPAIKQCYIGNGNTSWKNKEPISARKPTSLNRCLLLTTDHKDCKSRHGVAWEKLIDCTGEFRTWGDCFGYTLIAQGKADIMCDPILNLWDIAALIPILKGAGLACISWQGDENPVDSLVAAHPSVIDEIRAILQNQ